MLVAVAVKIDEIYVPGGLRRELDPAKVEAVAEEMLEGGGDRPIQVRRGKGRYVLIKGVHRLEAAKALGEDSIQAYLVHARLH